MFNADLAAPTAGYSLIPDGNYELKIIKTEEMKTKKGHPMVKCSCEVINNPEQNGSRITHFVSFLPKADKGSGMSTHFLKCINQPWEGEVTVDPIAWMGETFKAKIGTREYENKRGMKMKSNDIQEIESNSIPF